MRPYQMKKLACFFSMLVLAACGGSTTGGGSGTRTVTGFLASPAAGSTSFLKYAVADCAADTVIATDTAGNTVTAAVDDDCGFSLTLTIGASYAISFAKDGVFVAVLVFESGTGEFLSSTFTVSDGESGINLGTITITGNTGIPANNPLGQNDTDGDGQNDLDDLDDDNDGIDDDEEADCDLDGVDDDIDRDDDDCDDEAEDDDGAGNTGKVLEVKPRNDPQPDRGDDTVDLDKVVRVRIACALDETTVTDETFVVASEDGTDTIACVFDFNTDKGGTHTKIRCEHDEQDFLPNTVYSATIDGILCEDGTPVESVTWSWRTEDADDDEGDAEDNLEDEDEHEDEESSDDGEGNDEAEG